MPSAMPCPPQRFSRKRDCRGRGHPVPIAAPTKKARGHFHLAPVDENVLLATGEDDFEDLFDFVNTTSTVFETRTSFETRGDTVFETRVETKTIVKVVGNYQVEAFDRPSTERDFSPPTEEPPRLLREDYSHEDWSHDAQPHMSPGLIPDLEDRLNYAEVSL